MVISVRLHRKLPLPECSTRPSVGTSRNASGAFLFASLLLVSAILFVPISRASAAPSVVTLTNPNAQAAGGFGASVAASGNLVVVGASGEIADGYSGAGNVYIFNAATGALLSTLTSPNAVAGGSFGSSVAASGNLVVVGASGETVHGHSLAGDVYIFNATTGVLVSTLDSPNAGGGGNFGASVATSGNIVAIGATGETGAGGNFKAGNAYTFNATTGALVSTLSSPYAEQEGGFGSSVATNGKIAMVGAPLETPGNNAYTFNTTTGAPLRTLASPNAQGDTGFGWSVASSGNIVIVGSIFETASGYSEAGNAYTFNAATGAPLKTLTSPNAAKTSLFGSSVAASGNLVVVGADGETVDGYSRAGNTYAFNATTGATLSTLTSPNAQAGGSFGLSVAASGSVVVVGAPSEAADGHSLAGNVYMFTVTPSTTPVPEFPVQSLIAILTITVALVAVMLPKNQKTGR